MEKTPSKKNEKNGLFPAKENPILPIITGLIVTFVVVFVAFKAYSFHQKIKPVHDNPKTEMKKLPKEFEKRLQTASQSATFRVPILLYHYVEYIKDKKDTKRASLNINPYTFEQEIITLKNAGYTFMTAHELGEALDGRKQMPDKPVVITIDDGHWDVDTVILPILKKYNVKATAYIVPGFTGGSDFMSKEQVEDVIKSGLIEIGAHTIHHVSLKGLPLVVVQKEVQVSKQMLEDTYNIHIDSFAYPNGSFDKRAEDVVKDAGFNTAVTTVRGIDANQTNRFFLYRIRPGGLIGVALINYLESKKLDTNIMK